MISAVDGSQVIGLLLYIKEEFIENKTRKNNHMEGEGLNCGTCHVSTNTDIFGKVLPWLFFHNRSPSSSASPK